MIYKNLNLNRSPNGDLIATWEGDPNISQHTSEIYKLRVKLGNFNLLPSETLHVSFSDSLDDDLTFSDVTHYIIMSNNYNGTWDLAIPPVVLHKRGNWYLCIGIFSEWEDDTPTLQEYSSPCTFAVTATIQNINGKTATKEDIQSIYRQAFNAVETVREGVAEAETIRDENRLIANQTSQYAQNASGFADTAKSEADRAEAEANRAETDANRSNSSALLAENYASFAEDQKTNAKNEADRSKTEADNAMEEANRAKLEADRAATQAVNAKTSSELSEEKALEASATLQRIQTIASNLHKALVFPTVQSFLLWWQNGTSVTANGQSYTKNDLNIGDDIYIVEEGYSDIWYTGQAEMNPDTWWNGLPFTKLETDKTELVGYTERAELAKEQAEASALIAKNEADRATTQAKKSEEEADRAHEEAVLAENTKNELIDNYDKLYALFLNNTNTTAIFKIWYGNVKKTENNKYRLLERFFAMLASNNDDVQTVRFYSAGKSSSDRGTPLDSLAGKKAQQLATDNGVVATANKWIDANGTERNDSEDWATENRMTWYVRANALSLADGTMDVKAIEGVDDTFDLTGVLAPVYTFQLSPWYKEERTDDYIVKYWRANQAEGFHPFNDNVNLDGTARIITWHPTFGGVLISGNKLTSGIGRVKNFTAATTGDTYAKNWNANEGVGADANAKWILSEWQRRHFAKENGGILEGCLSYNYQYRVAITEENANRVILTTAQGENFIVGSNVEVGDTGSTSTPNRGSATAYNLSKHSVKITAINPVTIDGTEYSALTLELDDPITTTSTTWVSTMPWNTGTTEALDGHNDGSIVSLTNGRYPIRVAGIEVLVGAYLVGLDVLYNITSSGESNKFNYDVYECKDSSKYASSITANYVNTGISYEKMAQGWNYVKEFFLTDKPVLFPSTVGGSSSGWYKSAFDGSRSAGVRCPWRFGSLNDGGVGGLAYENRNASPDISGWHVVPWLAGAEKKRGEYSS